MHAYVNAALTQTQRRLVHPLAKQGTRSLHLYDGWSTLLYEVDAEHQRTALGHRHTTDASSLMRHPVESWGKTLRNLSLPSGLPTTCKYASRLSPSPPSALTHRRLDFQNHHGKTRPSHLQNLGQHPGHFSMLDVPTSTGRRGYASPLRVTCLHKRRQSANMHPSVSTHQMGAIPEHVGIIEQPYQMQAGWFNMPQP